MENKRITDANNEPQKPWEKAETQGDWQLAESNAEDTAELLTANQLERDDEHLHASADDPDDDDLEDDDNDDDDDIEDDDDADEPRDWGQVDPLDSPLPDSNDPSGPGSAV